MKFLITGGAGFIGSHVTEFLCNQGHDVLVLDDLRFGYKEFVDKRARFFQVSLDNREAIEKLLTHVEVVIHLAASSIISRSITDPVEYYHNNIMNGVNLLEAMRKKHVKKIIYSSTASVYGEPTAVPIKETDNKSPMTAYGASKLGFEYILNAYYHSYGIESVSLRYYNAYGPRDEQRPRSRAIPMWIEAVLCEIPIPWYWQGRQVRDYVYVTDIAQAHLDVLHLKGADIFNIGSGTGILMSDVLHTLEEVVGRNLKTKDLGQRPGDPMKLVADISHIQNTVGWSPKVSLSKGLEETYLYYKKRFEKK